MERELTILMPCLNEAETIEKCIQMANDFLTKENINGEVLISDNGSTDGSQALAEKLGARVVHTAQRGYGAALIHGIASAHGKYIIMGDADASYDFSNLKSFVEKLRDGYNLVMGNRFQGGIRPGAMPFLNRYVGNPILSFLGRLFFKCPIRDFHCGLRGVHRDTIHKLNLQTPGMEFASEMVVKAVLNKLKITEVPTTLSPDGRSRPPHLRKWRDGWRHLSFLLLSSPRWMFLYPGLILSLIGFVLTTTLVFAPFKVGRLAFDIDTLLFSCGFIVIGFQAIYFSIFSKIIANYTLGLPLGKKLEFLLQQYSLEKGIIIGIACMVLGLIGSSYSLFFWMKLNFGQLAPSEIMRLTIPSVTLLIIGSQIIFSSFFMKIVLIHHNIKVMAGA